MVGQCNNGCVLSIFEERRRTREKVKMKQEKKILNLVKRLLATFYFLNIMREIEAIGSRRWTPFNRWGLSKGTAYFELKIFRQHVRV